VSTFAKTDVDGVASFGLLGGDTPAEIHLCEEYSSFVAEFSQLGEYILQQFISFFNHVPNLIIWFAFTQIDKIGK